MNILWLWLIIGVILAVRKRTKVGEPLLGSTYLGIVLAWPIIYFFKLLDKRF